MAEIETELLQLADRQEALANALSAPEVNGPIEAMERAARAVEKAWSKSWLGYQAYIYYRDLEPPPPGAHFSSEWGFQQLQTVKSLATAPPISRAIATPLGLDRAPRDGVCGVLGGCG